MKIDFSKYLSVAPTQKACKKLKHRLNKENPSVAFDVFEYKAVLNVKKNNKENELFLSVFNQNKDNINQSLMKGDLSEIKKFLTNSVSYIDKSIRYLKVCLKEAERDIFS